MNQHIQELLDENAECRNAMRDAEQKIKDGDVYVPLLNGQAPALVHILRNGMSATKRAMQRVGGESKGDGGAGSE